MNSLDFALFGSEPAFDEPIPIGQLYFPSWERYEAAFQGIFNRRYYINNGPLLEMLEEKLQVFLGVKHAVCVGNATLGLMILADAMNLSGKVILPSFTFIASAQSLTWAGIEPVFCDIDPDSHQMDIDRLDALIDPDVSGIMGVNLWGGACNPGKLSNFAASNDIQLYFDSAHAFGCAVDGVRVGSFGCAEVFSFHATKILNACEGGCVCTNDDELAARLRSIRPTYGSAQNASVLRIANTRMSEAQAAIALMSLEDFPDNQQHNQALFYQYKAGLCEIPGLNLVEPNGVSFSNYQYLVCTVDEKNFGLSRDLLVALLKAENIIARRYFYPGVHRSIPYAQEFPQYLEQLIYTDRVCSTCILFPIGALVSEQHVEHICHVLARAQKASLSIRARYEE